MRLTFWLRAALRTVGCSFLGVAVYSLFMPVSTSSNFGIDMILLYAVFIFNIMEMVVLWRVLVGPVSLCLSFGSTRREAFFGVLVYSLLPIALGTGIVTALSAGLPLLGLSTAPFLPGTLLPLSLATGLWSAAAGLLCALLKQRFGNAAAITVYILFLTVFVGILVLGALEFLPLKPGPLWALTGASGTAYGFVLIPMARTLDRFAVSI